jgi:hypothetical protein
MTNQIALLGDLYSLAEKQLNMSTGELFETVPVFGHEPSLVEPLIAFEEADPPLGEVEEAAVFGAWIIREKPFPRDNREIGFRFMLLMLKNAGKPWLELPHDAFLVEEMLDALEAEAVSLAKFADWVSLRVRIAEAIEGEATA